MSYYRVGIALLLLLQCVTTSAKDGMFRGVFNMFFLALFALVSLTCVFEAAG